RRSASLTSGRCWAASDTAALGRASPPLLLRPKAGPAMSETAIRTPVALDATGRCLHCLPVDADIVGLFGHDPLGHRIVSALLRHGVDSVAQLARYTTLELSL